MTWADPREPHFGQPEIPHQPFCIYLARQFIAKKGFEPASVPEAEKLAAVSGYWPVSSEVVPLLSDKEKADYHISSTDPHGAASEVNRRQAQLNSDMVRNLAGVVQ